MKRCLSHLVRLLPAAAAIALFVFTLRNADLGHSLVLIGSLGFALPLLLLPYLVTIVIESFGWRLAFARFGRALPFIGIIKVRLTAEAFAMGLPSGNLIGESLQPYLLKRRCQLPFEEGAAGVVARKFFVILSQGLFLALSAAVGYRTLQRVSMRAIGRPGLPWLLLTTSAALLVVAATLAAALVYGRVAQRSRRALERLGLAWLGPWLERNALKFHEADAHLARFFSHGLGRLMAPLPFFLGVWLAKSLESALVLRLLGVPLAFSSVMAFETVLTLARSLLVPVPGGLGVQDLGYILCLRALDVPEAQTVGAAFILLKRAKEAIWMAVGFALLPSGGKRLATSGPPDPGAEAGQAANIVP
jgi:glycosyltransferase 2 family protein